MHILNILFIVSSPIFFSRPKYYSKNVLDQEYAIKYPFMNVLRITLYLLGHYSKSVSDQEQIVKCICKVPLSLYLRYIFVVVQDIIVKKCVRSRTDSKMYFSKTPFIVSSLYIFNRPGHYSKNVSNQEHVIKTFL